MGYFSKCVIDWCIEKGKEMYVKYDKFLYKLSERYGVFFYYLFVFWGLEINFGFYKGKMLVFDLFVILVCDKWWSIYFI